MVAVMLIEGGLEQVQVGMVQGKNGEVEMDILTSDPSPTVELTREEMRVMFYKMAYYQVALQWYSHAKTQPGNVPWYVKKLKRYIEVRAGRELGLQDHAVLDLFDEMDDLAAEQVYGNRD